MTDDAGALTIEKLQALTQHCELECDESKAFKIMREGGMLFELDGQFYLISRPPMFVLRFEWPS